ncbi:MAG: oligosaccharide flippase family protein [Fimbriimonadales bacterium]
MPFPGLETRFLRVRTVYRREDVSLNTVKKAVVGGFAWQVASLVAQRGVVFLAYVVFGRTLSREEIGIVGVAVAITVFVDMLRAGGVLQALIQFPDEEKLPDAVSATFWMTLLSGAGWMAALVIVGLLLPGITGSQLIGPIMMVLAVTALIDNLRLVPMAVLSRQLKFKQRAIADSAGSIVGAALGVGALFVLPADQKIWAIVVMFVARSLVTTIAHFLYSPTVPTRKFNRPVAKSLALVGWENLSSNLASGSLENLTLLMVKARTTFDVAGVFDMATRAMSPPTSIAHAANNTLFPVLAQSANDPAKSRERVLRSLKNIAIVAGGILGWLAAISPAALPLVFGGKWFPAVIPAQFIALGILFRTYAYTCTNALLAVRKPKPAAQTWWITLAVAAALMLLWPMSGHEAIIPSVIFAAFNLAACLLALKGSASGFDIPLSTSIASVGVVTLTSMAAFSAGLLPYLLPTLSPLLQVVGSSLLFGLVFLAACGKINNGSWTSLMSVSGLRALMRSA